MNTVRGNSRDESGATAVMVAVMAALLLTVSALSVDIGNAWARKRAAQKQVDVAALAAGHLLPVTTPAERTAIADAVVASMKQAENSVTGQDLSGVTGSTMLTGGLITFQDNAGNACNAGSLCTQMTVQSPLARVDFGLGRVTGATGADVTRTAVVRVESELPRSRQVLPFWLPSGCSFGPAQSDTTGGNGGNSGNSSSNASTTTPPVTTTASPTATTTTQTSAPITVSPVGVHSITGTSYTVTPGETQSVTGYTVTNVPTNTDRATIRFISPDGTSFVDFAVAENNPRGTLIVPDFTVGTSVTSIVGTWSVFALIKAAGSQAETTYSLNHLSFTVGSPTTAPTTTTPTTTTPTTSEPTSATSETSGPTSEPTTATTSADPTTASPTGNPVGCVGSERGNFGQLASPRRDVTSLQVAFAYNIAIGLDHHVVPYDFEGRPVTDSCETGPDTTIENAQLDDVSRDGNNCITSDTGNDGPRIYDGLISGVGGHPGRLDVANGATTCPGRSDLPYDDKTINNDTLSCFLRNGATLGNLMQTSGVTESMLRPEIVNSPRFVWLPTVYATHRSEHDFQPVKEFVPAFITDESWNGTSNVPAGPGNGLTVNGNSVETLTVFTFNKAALPAQERSPSTDYDPAIGHPIVRLVA